MGQSYTLFRGLAWETNCREQDTANSRRQQGSVFTRQPCPPALGPELGRPMPAAWQVQAAGPKPPVKWPMQSREFSDVCLWGLLCFICSLCSQQRPLHLASLGILNPILLESSKQNHLLSKTFLSLPTLNQQSVLAAWPLCMPLSYSVTILSAHFWPFFAPVRRARP